MTEAVPISIVKRRGSTTPSSPPLGVKKYEGLSLEPPTKDLVEVGDGDGDTEAVTKEEEWITKRKTELITKRQIETRVKRQVVLQDGKVVEDTGPIISTNTTEDTEKQETESSERRNLGNPDVVDGPAAIEYPSNGASGVGGTGKELANTNEAGKMVHTLVARPDGLVRETNDKRVVSREEVQERLETEDVRHLGDFSDKAYVNAVNSGVENIEEVLYSPEHQKQLVPLGPRIVHQSTKAHKTVDTEDVEQKYLAKPDGTIVTEKKKTTEHEELFDEDLPDKDENSTGSREKINQTESSQKYYKQRDEQNVEYVADGEVIGKEMRYVAETEQMERDGPPESPGDWDSLSDRIRKARRTQKTLLQQQKEAAVLADRKDALTKRPLDFDREEETRKGETIKWLESHFGSESTSSSRDGSGDVGQNIEIEPTKKTFFNVTIKSNQTKSSPTSPTGGGAATLTATSPITHPGIKAIPNGRGINDTLSSPSKVIMPDRELATVVGGGGSSKTKYFQGISNWSERKESTPRHFSSKAFRDELEGTIANNRLRRPISREDVRYPSKVGKDDYVRKEDILQQKHAAKYYNYNSRNDARYRKDSKEDSDDSRNFKIQKEDLGYLSGSRTDLRYRRDSADEIDRSLPNRTTNGYLKREDSGYVKDSREDIRSSLIRDVDEEREKYRSSLIQRDDSAYVSSSTYFTDTRLPKTPLRTPDSGIRSPSPDIYDPDLTAAVRRPSVPQRKRAIEKKLRQQQNGVGGGGGGGGGYSPPSPQEHDEPPPDYSPPPRSRSVSPIHHSHHHNQVNHHHISTGTNHIDGPPLPNGITSRKQNQRTRFASESSSASHSNNNNNNHHNHNSHINNNNRPTTVATQTIETQTSPPPKQSSKVGQAIGNSLRKLVGKIRSASAERKLRIKSKSKSRDRSPSPPIHPVTPPVNGSTYQQYNVIDSHISGQPIVSRQQSQHQQQQQQSHHLQNSSTATAAAINRDSSVVSSSITAGLPERDRDRDRERRGSSDIDMITSPKQRYYLGEDPYGGSIFGKENKYDGVNSRPSQQQYQQQPVPNRIRRQNGEEREFVQRNITSSTLGRYNKSNARLGSTPNLDHDYRNSQTLPRKLERPNHHSSTINVSIVNSVQKKPVQNTGPAKPARTYKSLNRSKSFNVHGMNGTNDPSPIYIEKITRNTGNNISGGNTQMYKSNPHLHETGPQLKSPSIVNLISRSQRDLTRIDETDHMMNNNNNITNSSRNGGRRYSSNYTNGGGGAGERRYSTKNDYMNGNSSSSSSKKNLFLKDLQDKAPELYKTLHGVGGGGDDEPLSSSTPPIRNGFSSSHHKYPNIIARERESSSLGSRSPIEINKDTASIVRHGGSSSTEDYSETYRITTKSDDVRRPSVTNTVQSFSKKTIPARDGRGGFETIQSSERKSVTRSRYSGEPMSNLKYMDEQVKRGTGGGPVVIEVRGNSRK